MRTPILTLAKMAFVLLAIATVTVSCDKEGGSTTETTTIQLYIEELEPCAMTSCNYAQKIDPESNILRLKIWLSKRVGSDYEYRSFELYSESPTITIDNIPQKGEYTLYGWADYVRPNGDGAHFELLDLPGAHQADFALNDDSYGAYYIVARIKNGKLVDSDGRMKRATTKYRIVTDDEELAARVATIEVHERGEHITAGLNLKTESNNLFEKVYLRDNKATYVDEPRCLATLYTMINFRNQEHSLERNLIITLKDADGEEIVTYKNIAALVDNDLLTTIVLPAPDRKLDAGEYALSNYNEIYNY